MRPSLLCFGRTARWLDKIGILVRSAACVSILISVSICGADASAIGPTIAVPVLDDATSALGKTDATFENGVHFSLGQDFTNRRPSDEITAVSIAQDNYAMYVVFKVSQREAIVEENETNGPGVVSDDYVAALFAPNGSSGFQYAFYANARGARYQTSSENTAYSPQWTATSVKTTTGYDEILRIPFNVIRSAGRSTWRAQFLRSTVHSNSLSVWSYDDHAADYVNPAFFGTLTGLTSGQTSSTRVHPRAQVYALGEISPKGLDGNTSRVGADLSLPLTPTASFVASLHPDYSNVEVDQQTIAPSAFPRFYSEVRPFFTQVAAPFNASFYDLGGPVLEYTPAIPTFADGYAVEGNQGPVTFSAFDTVSRIRVDKAAVATYSGSSPARSYSVSVQNANVDTTDNVHDSVTSIEAGIKSQHTHFSAYADYASEFRAYALPGAKYYQAGLAYSTATSNATLSYLHLGQGFSPVDSFVSQNDVSGPEAYVSRTFLFKPSSVFHDVSVNSYYGNFHNARGLQSQNDATMQVNLDFSDLVSLHAVYAEIAARTATGQFLPFDQSGFFLGYKTTTSTPTYVQYLGGPYYNGHLDAWTYVSTVQIAPRTHLAAELDEDQYLSTALSEVGTNQWLERLSLDVQLDHETQIDFGARRVFGTALPGYSFAPTFAASTGGNLSFALHHLARDGRSELYAVYGDPNSLSTLPALYLKYIRYFGAQKGT